MKKVLLVSLIFLFVATGAFATSMRVLTMGETNNILIDDNNIWLYPSRILNYPNLAIAEVKYSSDLEYADQDEYNDGYTTENDRVAQFGVHWKFGEKNPWVVGTYFYNDDQPDLYGSYYCQFMPYRTWMSSDMYNWISYPPTETDNEGFQKLNLFIGHEFGGYKVGFQAGLMGSSVKNDYTGNEAQLSFSIYDFAFGVTNAAGNLDVSANLLMMSWTDKNAAGYDNWKPDGNMAFMLRGRYFHKVNSTVTFVPNASFALAKAGAKAYNYTATLEGTEKYNYTSFSFGCGMHYTPVQKVLAVLDLGMAITSGKQTVTPEGGTAAVYKDSYTTLPYLRMGMEADVFNWLDIRLGSSSYWQHETVKSEAVTPNPKTKWSYPDNKTYLGFGLNFNRLHIDTYTDPNLFLHGFNFISGETRDDAERIDMNFGLSVLYEMF